jgi:hypothetical protein
MRQAGRWQIVLASLVLAGCSRQAPAPAAAAKPGPGFDSISLARGACYRRCPVYHIEIDSSGKATFTGEEWVNVKGVRVLHLSQDDIALLSAALRRTAFWTLKDRYLDERDGCTAVMTDFPSLSIRVVSGGKTKSVMLYQGCQGPAIPSDALGWLANTIDFVADTRPLAFDPDLYK